MELHLLPLVVTILISWCSVTVFRWTVDAVKKEDQATGAVVGAMVVGVTSLTALIYVLALLVNYQSCGS